jgi:dimeric dUTPase (all-alpha-NTP-PPase superfamily)
MNLTKLFNMQRELDNRIVEQHGLQGQDLLPQKILALQVELGECANEWRGFKFWSSRQTPTEPKFNWKPNEDGSNLEWNPEYGYESHPLLEEYIDCLHFILSIGLDIGYDYDNAIYLNAFNVKIFSYADGATEQFNNVFSAINHPAFYDNIKETNYELYEELFLEFLGLGERLGFKWEQIEEAYLNKNKVNHERQDTNY